MTSEESAEYRLQEAEKYLAEAEQLLGFQQWRSCVSSVPLAVENAAKAILACLGPVPRTHNTVNRLEALLFGFDWPEELASEVKAALPIFADYGLEKHILVTYGDEENFRTPWALFGEEEATSAVEDARQCVALAKAVYNHFFK